MEALTEAARRKRFQHCRQTIKSKLDDVFEVAALLMEIRDEKLYRDEFKTFSEFCESEFKIGKSRAYQLIAAARVKSEMSTIVDKPGDSNIDNEALTNEAQVRVVAKIPPEKRSEVLSKARAAGPLTSASIAKAAEEVCGPEPAVTAKQAPPKPVIELDCTGFAIPAKCLPLWQRRPEVQKVLTALSNVRTALRAAQEAQDVLWQPVTNKGETWTMLLKSLDQAYATTGVAMPYAVCPTCQGQLADMCIECKGRGMVSEFYYKYQCSSDIRKIRETVCKSKP